MTSKTSETSREKFRMVPALLPDTPKPPNFNTNYSFLHFLPYFQFASFYRMFRDLLAQQKLEWGGVG